MPFTDSSPSQHNNDKIDYGRSIHFRFDRRLQRPYWRLRNILVQKIWSDVSQRERVRPQSEREIFFCVDCILANFLDAHRISSDCFVGIPLSEASYTKSRYVDLPFGYTNFRRVVEYLKRHDPPLVVYKDGFNDPRSKTGRVSRFKPAKHLIDLINGYTQLVVIDNYDGKQPRSGPDLFADAIAFSNLKPVERISLPEQITTYQRSSDAIRLKNAEKQLTEYEDTPETIRMRQELETWNSFVADHHHIDLLLPDAQIETLYKRDDNEEGMEAFLDDERDRPQFVEFERVRLYRVFNNGSFNEGGRFYGGWWQNVPSAHRQFITINERATWEYDYSNLHPAMLYAKVGMRLEADAYEIQGIEPSVGNRKLIKTTFLKLINAQRGQRIDRPRSTALPEGWNWERLVQAIMEKHKPIAGHFRSGIGLQLQKVDSEVAWLVMRHMMERDILVLPVHDSFITYHELKDELEHEMRRAYAKIVGGDIEIRADISLVNRFIEELDGFELLSEEVIDHFQDQPEYNGFRQRHCEFFRTRPHEWHYRFLR